MKNTHCVQKMCFDDTPKCFISTIRFNDPSVLRLSEMTSEQAEPTNLRFSADKHVHFLVEVRKSFKRFCGR